MENLKREYAGTVYFDRYINGMWIAAEGSIYRAFADNPQKFIISADWLKTHPLTTATIGVDFGGNFSMHTSAKLCTCPIRPTVFSQSAINPRRLSLVRGSFRSHCFVVPAGCVPTYVDKLTTHHTSVHLNARSVG